MAKNLFTFPCPCCNKMIEVDTRSGKARAVRADEKKGGQNLDDMLHAAKKDSERLGDLFSSAKDNEKNREEILVKLQLCRSHVCDMVNHHMQKFVHTISDSNDAACAEAARTEHTFRTPKNLTEFAASLQHSEQVLSNVYAIVDSSLP